VAFTATLRSPGVAQCWLVLAKCNWKDKKYTRLQELNSRVFMYIGFYVNFVLFAAKWKRERVFMYYRKNNYLQLDIANKYRKLWKKCTAKNMYLKTNCRKVKKSRNLSFRNDP
jgi:hypothetical protein